ncbi:MAG: glycosyltransferase, partial [Bacteroidota bacterium]|nr:glycosyltransferase [Bacteroidota bacterium]
MRVLQLCNRLPWPLKDGGAIAMHQVTRGLHEQGVDVHLLSFNTKKHFVPDEELPPLFRELGYFETVYLDAAVTPWRAAWSLLTGKSLHISRFASGIFRERLTTLLRKHTYDIIHLDILHMSVYLDTIRKHSDAAVVLRAQNVEHMIWLRLSRSEPPGPKKWLLTLLAKKLKNYETAILNQLDAIIPITVHDKLTFERLGCRIPQYVAPTGLDISRYPYEPDKAEWPSIFHIGALNWLPNRQGVMWFLDEIWPELHTK